MFDESRDFDPALAASVVMRVVELDEPPKRVVLGGPAYDMVQRLEREYTDELVKWEHLSRQGD